MFYFENDINDVKVCLSCRGYYSDPRVLPCGHTSCNSCILHFELVNDDQEIQCELCTDTHLVPPGNGFPPNKALEKLLNKKPSEVHRSNLVTELKDLLGTLRKKAEHLNTCVEHGEDSIKDYFNLVRNKIQIKTDEAIEEIHKYNEMLVGEANEFERKCIVNFSRKQADLSALTTIEKFTDFCCTWSSYLNQFEIEDSEVEHAIKLAQNSLNKLKLEEDNLKAINFNSQMLLFNRSKATFSKDELIGCITYNKINYINTDFEEMKTLDLKNIIFNSTNLNCVRLNEEDFCFIYLSGVYLQIFKVSKEGKVIKCINNYENSSQISSFLAKSINGNVFIYYCKTAAPCFHVTSLNDNLDSINTVNPTITAVNEIAVNSKNVFTLYASNTVFASEWSLSGARQLNFVVPTSTVQMEANDDNLFFLSANDSQIRVISIESETCTNTIDVINKQQFSLIYNSIVVSHDRSARKMLIYEREEKKYTLEDIALDKRDSALVKGRSENFLFLDEANKELYYF
jgi:hypothetical protein